MWVDVKSFPIFASLFGRRATWEIHDAKLGLVEKGSFTVEEALAVTRPSVLKGKAKSE